MACQNEALATFSVEVIDGHRRKQECLESINKQEFHHVQLKNSEPKK